MKYLKILLVPLMFILAINEANTVFADDDFEKNYKYDDSHSDNDHHEHELYEDMGELIGWGAAVTIGAAGLIFPIRKLSKLIILTFPQFKQLYISITRFTGKYHILFGILALLLIIGHGLLMYFSEGELESEGIIGLIAFGFMVVAGIFGGFLFKNKKVKRLRTLHFTLVTSGVIVGILHIFVS